MTVQNEHGLATAMASLRRSNPPVGLIGWHAWLASLRRKLPYRYGGHDWLDELAIRTIALRLARRRGALRTAAACRTDIAAFLARYQYAIAEEEIAINFRPDPNYWLPIVRNRNTIDAIPAGQFYAVPQNGTLKILRRNVAA